MRYIIAMAAFFWAMHGWAGEVTISAASARATAPGQDSAAIQFSIVSQQDGRLIEIASPAAGSVEMHQMAHENGMMKMRAVEFLALPAGKSVDLAASGYHVMLLNLKQPLKAGDIVPFTLTVQFADRRKITVEAKAEVKPLAGATHNMHDMKM
ncbi:MAG: copper chaperone PCu(A)C [Pseudomonadota bacterium]